MANFCSQVNYQMYGIKHYMKKRQQTLEQITVCNILFAFCFYVKIFASLQGNFPLSFTLYSWAQKLFLIKGGFWLTTLNFRQVLLYVSGYIHIYMTWEWQVPVTGKWPKFTYTKTYIPTLLLNVTEASKRK